jgi:hypothetical protein
MNLEGHCESELDEVRKVLRRRVGACAMWSFVESTTNPHDAPWRISMLKATGFLRSRAAGCRNGGSALWQAAHFGMIAYVRGERASGTFAFPIDDALTLAGSRPRKLIADEASRN